MHTDKILTLDLGFHVCLVAFQKVTFFLRNFVFTALRWCLTGRLTDVQALLSCLVFPVLYVHVGQLVHPPPPGPTSSHHTSFLPCITDSSQLLLSSGGHTAFVSSLTRQRSPGVTRALPKPLHMSLLCVDGVKEQDICRETYTTTAVTPQLFNWCVILWPLKRLFHDQ